MRAGRTIIAMGTIWMGTDSAMADRIIELIWTAFIREGSIWSRSQF